MNENITTVTTFHDIGLKTYGQRFIDSFAKNVDKKIKLLVYTEDCEPVNPDPEQIIVLDAKTHLTKLNKFKAKWQGVPFANGECPFPQRRPKDNHKKFKWDAVRFANKTFAVFDAVQKSRDWCVWMDADIVVHSEVTYQDFKNLLPNDAWITYIGRGKKEKSWPECGFYGLNLNQKTCQEFISEFESMYLEAEDGIFTLDEWHDSFIFGTLLRKYTHENQNVHDYAKDIFNKTAKTGGGGHPFINSDLGKYFDHLKGDRKKQGKSFAKDVNPNRTESYWRAML